jgi:hypothetical protein
MVAGRSSFARPLNLMCLLSSQWCRFFHALQFKDYTLKPYSDEQILLYLWFSVPNIEGLDKAILHVKEDSPKSHTYELPLAETPFLRIRRHNQLWTPKNVLTPGWNDLFADYRFLSIATTTGNYNFEFRVMMPEPDGRLLFGFNQTFFLKGW